MKFWILWGFDALVALVFVSFFFVGLADGSVSSFNIMLWLGILGFFAALLGGTAWLKSKGHGLIGMIVLAVPAFPALLYLAFILLCLITQPRWN